MSNSGSLSQAADHRPGDLLTTAGGQPLPAYVELAEATAAAAVQRPVRLDRARPRSLTD
jgi:hypothetical protein